MARNSVQFQKGLSLNEFLKAYGTEDQCFEALFALRWPDGFHCPHCVHDKCCQSTVRKLQQCNRCHNQTSITAGTSFESTKLSLTVWFQGMYLLTQNKKMRVGNVITAAIGYLLQRGLADEAQAHASDA